MVYLTPGFPSQLKQLQSPLSSLPAISAPNSETSANTSCCSFSTTVSLRMFVSIAITSFLADLLVLLGNLSESTFGTDVLRSCAHFRSLPQIVQGRRKGQTPLSFPLQFWGKPQHCGLPGRWQGGRFCKPTPRMARFETLLADPLEPWLGYCLSPRANVEPNVPVVNRPNAACQHGNPYFLNLAWACWRDSPLYRQPQLDNHDTPLG